MASFEGKWNLESSENFDAYMEAVGVNWMTRKIGASAKPVVTIQREGDLWKYKQETAVKSAQFDFKFGQEFDETTADGRKVKSTITQDSPTKWTQVQKADIPSTIIRELTDNNTLKVVVTAKDVTSTRVYKRAT